MKLKTILSSVILELNQKDLEYYMEIAGIVTPVEEIKLKYQVYVEAVSKMKVWENTVSN